MLTVALILLVVYACAGGLFAGAFLVRGVAQVDHAARNAPLGFRLIILPGVIALWPLLAIRWRGSLIAERTGSEANP